MALMSFSIIQIYITAGLDTLLVSVAQLFLCDIDSEIFRTSAAHVYISLVISDLYSHIKHHRIASKQLFAISFSYKDPIMYFQTYIYYVY